MHPQAAGSRIGPACWRLCTPLVRKVNRADVQVFEYQSAEGSNTEAAHRASWVGTPHVFKSGRVLVLLIGDDRAVLGPLTCALGRQFAGR